MTDLFRVGTRGSPLALAQTDLVIQALARAHPGTAFERVVIRSHGDEGRGKDLGESPWSKRAFTKGLEDALLEGRIDAAVHSLKDLPSELPQGLALGAVPERAVPWDALVSVKGEDLPSLPEDARIGTSSLRRKAQLLAYRRSFRVEPLEGNVGTRLRKLDEGSVDALVLASAGMIRLGLGERITEVLTPEVMVPAVGQGALAVETRARDAKAASMVARLDDRVSRSEVEAERALAARIGGGCNLPMGAIAILRGEVMSLDAAVAATDGSKIVRVRTSAPDGNPSSLAEAAARALLERGAGEILKEATLR